MMMTDDGKIDPACLALAAAILERNGMDHRDWPILRHLIAQELTAASEKVADLEAEVTKLKESIEASDAELKRLTGEEQFTAFKTHAKIGRIEL